MDRGLRADLAKGRPGVPGNEVVDGEAKSGAVVVDPAHPYEYVTAVWAPGEDSRKWREAKISDGWGARRLLTSKRADIRGGSMQMLRWRDRPGGQHHRAHHGGIPDLRKGLYSPTPLKRGSEGGPWGLQSIAIA